MLPELLAADDVDDPPTYQIRVQGHLDRQWADWIGDVEITHTPNGDSYLVCRIRDQAALHGLLNQIFTLNVTLLAVYRQDSLSPDAKPTVRLNNSGVGLA